MNLMKKSHLNFDSYSGRSVWPVMNPVHLHVFSDCEKFVRKLSRNADLIHRFDMCVGIDKERPDF